MIIRDTNSEAYHFHIGLSDKESEAQKFSAKDFELVLKGICENYNTGYTITHADGGYVSDDGTFVREKSIDLSIIGITKEQAHRIGKDICFFFNQESVFVTKEMLEVLEIR